MSVENINKGWSLLGHAVLGTVQGVLIWWLIREGTGETPRIASPIDLALILGVVFGPLTFFLTVGRDRIIQPALISIGVAISAVLLTFTAQTTIPPDIWQRSTDRENGQAVFIASTALTVVMLIIAAHMNAWFKAGSDSSHHAKFFKEAWTLPVIGLGASFFVTLMWVILALVRALFEMIGIDVVSDVTNEPWFLWPYNTVLTAIGILFVRQRTDLLDGARGLLLAIARLLAPIFSIVIIVYLISFASVGYEQSDLYLSPATLLILSVLIGIPLFNALVFSDTAKTNLFFRITAVLLAIILPICSLLAACGMYIRIDTYGLTLPRVLGGLTIAILVICSALYFVGGVLRRQVFLERSNLALSAVLIAVAILILSPLFRISDWIADSQFTRIAADQEIDRETAVLLAFRAGEPGREVLERLKSGTVYPLSDFDAELIDSALESDRAFEVIRLGEKDALDIFTEALTTGNITVIPVGAVLPEDVRRYLGNEVSDARGSQRDRRTVVYQLKPDGSEIAVIERDTDAISLFLQIDVKNFVEISPSDADAETPVIVRELSPIRPANMRLRHHFESAEAAEAAFVAAQNGDMSLTAVSVPALVVDDRIVWPYDDRSLTRRDPTSLFADPGAQKTTDNQ